MATTHINAGKQALHWVATGYNIEEWKLPSVAKEILAENDEEIIKNVGKKVLAAEERRGYYTEATVMWALQITNYYTGERWELRPTDKNGEVLCDFKDGCGRCHRKMCE